MTARFALLVLLIAQPAAADILNVPADFPTIQSAVDAAQDGDEIVLAPGVYAGLTTIGRPLTVRIRSTAPADPAVVEQTVLANLMNGQILAASADAGETISVVLEGLTIRRDHPTIDFSPIEFQAASLEIASCRIDAGSVPAQGIVRVRDSEDRNRPGSLRIVDTSLTGYVGALTNFELASTEIVGSTFEAADVSLIANLDETYAFAITDSTFTNLLGTGSNPVIGVAQLRAPLADLLDVRLERLAFRDTERVLIETNGPLALKDITIERVRRNGGDIMRLGEVAIDGLTIRESGGLQGDFGLIQTQVLIAQNIVADDNLSEIAVFHVFGNGLDDSHSIEDSRFEQNTSRYAVVEVHGGGTLRRCDFIDNSIVSPLIGGAPFVNFGQGRGGLRMPAMIEECRFIGNNSELSGAVGLPSRYENNATVTISDSQFVGNMSTTSLIGQVGPEFAGAGAMRAAEVRQSLIVGNRTGTGLYFGATRYVHSTIAGNSSAGPQLGIGEATLVDTIFVPDDPNAALAELVDGSTATIGTSFSVAPAAIADTDPTTTSLDPLFIRPPSDGGDGWGDDPATPNIDESLNDDFGDLRLMPGSPAIDAGTNDFFTPGDLDLDGNPRFADDPGIPGASVDIGAYEFQGATCLPDVDQNGVVSPSDFNAWILAYNSGSPLADQNRNGEVMPSDFNAWILNFNAGCP